MEEKEKLANSGRYRQYKRFMKKNTGSTISVSSRRELASMLITHDVETSRL